MERREFATTVGAVRHAGTSASNRSNQQYERRFATPPRTIFLVAAEGRNDGDRAGSG